MNSAIYVATTFKDHKFYGNTVIVIVQLYFKHACVRLSYLECRLH
jgi:hypothetical protein